MNCWVDIRNYFESCKNNEIYGHSSASLIFYRVRMYPR